MIKKAVLLLFCLFSLSCNCPSDTCPPAPADTRAGASAVLAGSFAPGQLEAHYAKHGYQFGTISQEQYLAAAQQLLDSPVGGDVYGKTRANGDILRFRASTGEFAVMDSTGRIRTYFKADYRYWMRQ